MLTGEIVLVTDASDLGGGSTIFQWQHLEKIQIPEGFLTSGQKDGNLQHNSSEEFRLVPLGNWNWKWNSTRTKYYTYEQELLSAVLTVSSQFRILAGKRIFWFCDNQAIKAFLDNPAPNNPGRGIARGQCAMVR